MQIFRPSEARGHADFGWLNSRHSFSFGHYFDPNHMNFGTLRVINEDRVTPGAGFDTHGHRDMEIISIVLDGALEHKDSIGTGSVVRPNDIQRMSAGTGIRHSEYNYSRTEPVHFLQIWIVPERDGLEPGYEQRAFPVLDRQDRLQLVGSRDGRDGSVTIHQDVDLYRSTLTGAKEVDFPLPPGRQAWLQVTHGTMHVNGTPLEAGDGFGIADAEQITLGSDETAEFLLFDLAA